MENGNETAYPPSVIDLWMNFWTDLAQMQAVVVRSDSAPSSALFRGINYQYAFFLLLLLLSLHIIISEGSKRMSNQHSTDTDSQQITIRCIQFILIPLQSLIGTNTLHALQFIYFFKIIFIILSTRFYCSAQSSLGLNVARVNFCNCKQIASACKCERCKVICVSFRIAYEAPMKFRYYYIVFYILLVEMRN